MSARKSGLPSLLWVPESEDRMTQTEGTPPARWTRDAVGTRNAIFHNGSYRGLLVADDPVALDILAALNEAEALRAALTKARDYFARVPAAKATGADPLWLYVNSVLAGDASDEMLPEMFPRYGDVLKERDDLKKQGEALRERLRLAEKALRELRPVVGYPHIRTVDRALGLHCPECDHHATEVADRGACLSRVEGKYCKCTNASHGAGATPQESEA